MSVQLPETPKFLIEETKKKVNKRATSTPVVKIPATATLLQKELAKFDEEARVEEEYKKKNRERAERKKAELAMRSQAAVEALRAVKAAEANSKAEANAKIEAARVAEENRKTEVEKLKAAQVEALKKIEIKKQEEEEEEKKRQAELSAGLSWRTLLPQNENKESTQFDRSWGLLCERARGLAPETSWYFLLMNENERNSSVVANWRNWLERFICSYDWHSPREVEVVFNIENGRGVFTMSWKKAELPPPLFVNLMDWTVQSVTVNERAGFKMTYTESFISDKAGLA